MGLIASFFLNKLIILSIDAIAIFLAIAVYQDNPRGKLNRIYSVMTLLMICWVTFAYIPRIITAAGYEWGIFSFIPRITHATNYDLGVASLKIAWFATPLLFAMLYLVAIYLNNESKKYKILTFFVFACATTLSFVTGFSDLIITGLTPVDNVIKINYGPLMLPFLGVTLFIILATLVPLFRNEALLKEKRIKYFLIGIFIFYVLNVIFNITLPILFDISRLYFLGDYSTLILLGFTAYAIIRYQLFNIKIVATELFTFSICVFVLIRFVLSLSESKQEIIINGVLLIAIIVFGILLIRSVLKEVRTREKLAELTKELEKKNIELQKLDKAKSEFISIASHQLRTPISIIKGFISMLVEGTYGPLPDKVKDILSQKISASNDRMSKLIDDLLDLSRMEGGRMQFDWQFIKLPELIQSVTEELSPKAQEKNIDLKYVCDVSKNTFARADQGKLRQVIFNLIDNAIKYTTQGFVEVKVTKATEGKARIAVKDSGIGMDKEELQMIFGKFERGRRAPRINTEGAGLGLYIAKKILEEHRGKIWAESEGEGKGSTFFVELPVY